MSVSLKFLPMNLHTALTWSYLNILTKRRYDLLLEGFGSLDIALKALDEVLLKKLGCRPDTIIKVLNRLEEFDVASYELQLAKRSISFTTREDEEYPALLSVIDDAPIFLYYKGSLDIVSQSCIALVGTRNMSTYGKRVVEKMVEGLVRAGMVTVSGLAFGIDAEVARETLRHKGKTVGVVGHGLGMMYPKSNSALCEDIIKAGGLILSEFPLDTAPDKFTFPARNRIIAGLCPATVVLEAAVGSGSLITADLALDYNRDVYAVPGQIFDANYEGCHQIIATGSATLVTSPEAILADLGRSAVETSAPVALFEPQSPEETSVYSALTSIPATIDDLLALSGLSPALLNATLTLLEMQGAARNVGEGKWVRA